MTYIFHLHIHVHTHTCTLTFTFTHTHRQRICTALHACTYTQTHAQHTSMHTRTHTVHTHTHFLKISQIFIAKYVKRLIRTATHVHMPSYFILIFVITSSKLMVPQHVRCYFSQSVVLSCSGTSLLVSGELCREIISYLNFMGSFPVVYNYVQ